MNRPRNNRSIVISDSESDFDNDSDGFTDDASTTKRCSSHLSSKTKRGTSNASDNFNYNNLHGASSESNDDTLSAISNTKNSSYRNATAQSDNAAPSQTGESKILKRKADMGGIDPDNVITPSLRAPNESELSQSDHRRPRKSQRLTRGHGGSTVSYDMKHHPMDDILRPKYSAKRRGNQRQAAEESSDSDREIDYRQVAEESSDSDRDIDEDNEIGAPSKITSPSPHYRRSSRSVHLSNRPIYSAKWHPMDQMLKDNATSTRVLKGGDHDRNIRKSIESSPTLKGDEDSSTISLDLHPNHDGDRASGGRITPISPGQRRSARVSLSKNGPPNYDMKYHVLDSILGPQATRKRIESRLQSATSSKKFIKSPSSVKPQANHPARSPPKSLAGGSVGHGSGLAVPVAPTWFQLQNPYLSGIPLNWIEVQDMDRYIFLLQKGAPADSDALPQDWTSDIFEKYLLDEGIDSLVELSSRDKVELMKNRYETVRLGLEKFFSSGPEPTNKNCWTLSKTEGFNVYRLKSGSKYWRHQKDSIVEGTTSSISANVMGSTPETTKQMVGNRNQEAKDSISDGQTKSETKTPTSICNVTNEENRPNKPCLKLSPVMDIDTERTTSLDREDDSERGAITETEDTLIESMRGDHSVFSITSDAALEELLLPAEQSIIENSNREVAADLVSRASRYSEPARTVVTHPDQTLKKLSSVGPEAKAIGRKTSSTHRHAEAVQTNMETSTSGDIVGPRGKSDKPETPETQPKARKRKSSAGFTVLVHEDLPGRTPLIKKMVRMNPVSPGTDIPKENLEDVGLVENSSQVEMGIPQTRRRRTNEAIGTPNVRRVRHLGSTTTVTPAYRSLFSSPVSSRMGR